MVDLYLHSPYISMAQCLINEAHGQLHLFYAFQKKNKGEEGEEEVGVKVFFGGGQ
jgi:hypothetical protein